jgi:hypothetical protein
MLSLNAPKMDSFFPIVASDGCWQLLVFLGLLLCGFSPLCVWVLKGEQSLDEDHPKPASIIIVYHYRSLLFLPYWPKTTILPIFDS